MQAQDFRSVGAKTGVRGARYCEIFAVRRHGLQLESRVYNTFGLNDCSSADWSALDADALKKQLQVDGIVLNGPRYWMMDRIETNDLNGEVASLGGLQMRLVASMRVPLSRLAQGRSPYKETTIERTTAWIFVRGAPVFELTAPNGQTYVMQSYSQIVDTSLSQSDLPALAARLQLPTSWRYGSRILDEDLTLRALGKATIIQDDLQNTYQAR
jgi:hypothetical protein